MDKSSSSPNRSNAAAAFSSILISILLLVFAGYLVKKLWELFSGLQKEVAAALIAAFATITVSVITVVVGKYYERKRSIEQEIRAKKIPVYEDFIQFQFKHMAAAKTGEPVPEKDSIDFFTNFSQKIIIWGSDDVIRQWVTFRKSAQTNPEHLLYEMEKILLAIRRDTGHENKGFTPGDLMRVFVNDLK